jgi:hypothetical protein
LSNDFNYFFISYSQTDSTSYYQPIQRLHASTDFVEFWACPPENKAFRRGNEVSFFVRSICYNLDTFAETAHFDDIVKKVNLEMSNLPGKINNCARQAFKRWI